MIGKELILIVKAFLSTFFDKDTRSFKNTISFVTLLYSIGIVFIGFYCAVTQFYIGDTALRILFIIAGILFIGILLSCREVCQRQILPIVVFTIILFLVSYLLPQFPPAYDMRTFDLDASILKFLIVSILMIIIGLLSVNYSIKPLYGFTSKGNQAFAYFVLTFSILLIVYPLAVIVYNIVVNGAGGITWEFLTQDILRHGAKGGIFPALVGTILLIIGTALIALPLGIGCAVYLNEYAKTGPIVRIIRIAVDILQGVPSIVHGLFGLAFFVPLFGVSLLSGIFIMGFLTLPIIIRASEEAIRAVPQSIREGSFALGGTKWQTIRRVVLPPALPGIITGVVLGLGRAAGETAPIMFTAAVFLGAGVPRNIFEPIQALPTHLLQLTYYMGAYPVEQNAWATALLLLALVLGMNAVAVILREKYRVEFYA